MSLELTIVASIHFDLLSPYHYLIHGQSSH
jgi:hypothetical protein